MIEDFLMLALEINFISPLPWQPKAVVLASGWRPYSASISDLDGKWESSHGKSSLIYVVSYGDKNTN